MPNYENNDKKGSLYVTFDVVFPRDKQLTTAESEAVVGIFGDKQSASTVAYGVPMVREKGLAEGHTAPRVYNGFTSPSSAGKHLGNTLRWASLCLSSISRPHSHLYSSQRPIPKQKLLLGCGCPCASSVECIKSNTFSLLWTLHINGCICSGLLSYHYLNGLWPIEHKTRYTHF